MVSALHSALHTGALSFSGHASEPRSSPAHPAAPRTPRTGASSRASHPPFSRPAPAPLPTLPRTPPQAALAVLPAYPIPPIANRLSTWLARSALAYFPCDVLVEDPEAFAAHPSRPYVVGLEPHSVLPLSLLAFHPSGPLGGALGSARKAALAAPVVFW